MGPLLKKLLVGACCLFLLAAVLVTAAAFLIESDPARTWIQQAVNRNLPGSLSWEDTDLSLVPGKIVLKEIRLLGPDGDEIALWPTLSIDIAWGSLLRGRLVIEGIELDAPRLNLVQDTGGTLNLLKALVPPEDIARQQPETTRSGVGLPIDLVVDSLRIARGRISFRDDFGGARIELAHLDATASGDLNQRSGRLSLEASGIDIALPTGPSPIERVELRLELRDGRIDPLELTAAGAATRLRLAGSADRLWEAPILDLSADLDATLSELAGILQVKPALTGDVSARIGLRGAVGDPEIEVTIDYGGGLLFDRAVDGLRLEAALKGHRLTVDPAELRLADGRALFDIQLDLGMSLLQMLAAPQRVAAEAAYQARLAVENLHLQQLLADPGSHRGRLDGTLTVKGRGLSPETASLTVQATLDGSDLSADWLSRPVNLQARTAGSIKDRVVTISSLEAALGPIRLSASGRLDTASEAVEARLSLEGHGAEKLFAAPQLSAAGGNLRLDATAGGTLDAPLFDFDLKADDFRYDTVSFGDVSVKAKLGPDGVLKVSTFDIRNNASVVRGRGSLGLFDDSATGAPMRLSFDLTDLRPADFFSATPVDGIVSGKLSVSGSLAMPEAALEISARQVTVEGNRIGDIAAEAEFSSGTVLVSQLQVTNRRSKLEASGHASLLEPDTLKLLEDPRFNLVFDSPGIYLEDLTPELRGTITARGNLGGPIHRPEGRIELSGSGIDTGYQRLQQVSAAAKMAGGRIEISRLEAVLAEEESVQGSGWIDTGGRFGLELFSKGLSLEKIGGGRLENTVTGNLAFSISGGGTLAAPDLRGKASTSGLHLNGKPVDDADLTLSLSDNRLQVSGRLNFDIDGALDLRRHDFQLTARFDQTDLVPYFKAAGQPDLAGTLTGNLRASGSLNTVEQVTAVADIGTLNLDYRKQEVLNVSGARLSLADATLSTPALRLNLPGGSHVDVTGSGRLDGALDVAVKGAVPLEALALLTDEVSDLSGRLALVGTVRGTTQAPEIDALLTFVNAGLSIPEIGQTITAVKGDIRVDSKQIRVNTLEGRVGEGNFRLDGRVDLQNFRPGRGALTFEASAIPFEIPNTMDMRLSSRLDISGTPEAIRVKGETVLLEGSYYRDVALDLPQSIQSLAAKKRQVAVEPDGGTSPFLDRVRLNVAIRRKQPFVVDNNLAWLEIEPDLTLIGTLGNPVLTGRAKVAAGTVTYGKTLFDIQKGTVDFNNPYRIEPQFDIEGQTQVRDWLITLVIRGTPEALELALSSDPPLESSEIGSLLVFGKTPQELSGGQGPGAGQSASNMLAELLAANYASDIKKATGLDVFEVDAQADSGTKEEHITVTVGKEISERMTLKLGTESRNGELVQRAIAEYRVLENLLVSGFQDTSGSFGGSVKYRLEFR